jgi:hypothetical protein
MAWLRAALLSPLTLLTIPVWDSNREYSTSEAN